MLGISTSYFSARGYSIYNSVKKAYEMGFRLIELGANHDYEENIWQTIEKIAKDFPDVIFTQHCHFPPVFIKPILSNSAEGLTKENEKVLKATFKAVEILNTKVVSFHPGFNTRFEFAGQFSEWQGFKKFIKVKNIKKKSAANNMFSFFKEALREAKKTKVLVAIENVYSVVANNPTIKTYSDFADFLARLPELKFLFDYGHAALIANNPNQFFSLGEKIIEMHLHDVNKKNLDHRILGTGKVNLKSLFFEIKKLKIKPYLILEHSGEPEEKEIVEEKKLVEKYLEIN